MAAFGIDAELRLVDRREGELIRKRALCRPVVPAGLHRHRFRRAQDVARLRRDDALLAGQKRDLFLALDCDDALVDLTGQKPQRETDDTR